MRRRDFATLLAALPAAPRIGSSRWPALAQTPELSAEAMGWLAHLHRKVSLGGTWHKHDTVGPQWDTTSFVPTMAYARYEPTWLSWSIGLMAETTPAWREEYARVLGFVADRCLEYWAFYEWVEHTGDDPGRAGYPERFKRMVPEGHWGRYNIPGWAANGTRKEPFDPDPIRAGGRFGLMYKGYLNLILSMYRYVSDDGKYDRPFTIRYDDNQAWTYDHARINRLLADQWRAHEEGIACEVTKIYPWCNTLSGAGTRLYDAAHGTRFTDAYYRWQRYYAQHYVGSKGGQGPDWLTGYYDSDLGVGISDHGQINGGNWVATTWHGVVMDDRLFEPLYRSLMRLLYRPQPHGMAHLAAAGGTDADLSIVTGLGAALAREMGDHDKADAIRRWIDARYQPLWDRDRGEFAYGFDLGEPWPRGQYNAWVMPALLVEQTGRWRGLFARPNFAKFTEPTVEGVDFPAVRVKAAQYSAATRTLTVVLAPGTRAAAGTRTSFRITRLAPTGRYAVSANGGGWVERVATDGVLSIETTVGDQRFQVRRVG
jgi:Linalool dehydratase/isomerase